MINAKQIGTTNQFCRYLRRVSLVCVSLQKLCDDLFEFARPKRLFKKGSCAKLFSFASALSRSATTSPSYPTLRLAANMSAVPVVALRSIWLIPVAGKPSLVSRLCCSNSRGVRFGRFSCDRKDAAHLSERNWLTPNEKQLAANQRDELLWFQVGAARFELATSCSQSRRAARLRYAPRRPYAIGR